MLRLWLDWETNQARDSIVLHEIPQWRHHRCIGIAGRDKFFQTQISFLVVALRMAPFSPMDRTYQM